MLTIQRPSPLPHEVRSINANRVICATVADAKMSSNEPEVRLRNFVVNSLINSDGNPTRSAVAIDCGLLVTNRSIIDYLSISENIRGDEWYIDTVYSIDDHGAQIPEPRRAKNPHFSQLRSLEITRKEESVWGFTKVTLFFKLNDSASDSTKT